MLWPCERIFARLLEHVILHVHPFTDRVLLRSHRSQVKPAFPQSFVSLGNNAGGGPSEL
jgi:hypothetical protein